MNISLRRVVLGLVIALFVCAIVAGLAGTAVLPRLAPAASVPALLGTGTGAGAPAVGRSASDFTLEGLDGQTVSLKGLRGKVVVLNFWATWCPPCIAEMGNLEKSYQQHSSEGVVVVGVNQGEKPEDVKGFTEIYRLSFPMALDRQMQVGDLYRIRNLPTTVFIDRQGNIAEIHVGGPMSGEFLEGRITGLLRK